ncbi:uncharacterized protein LOC114973131 [Acropora millepora]|uniref:uncharacterized protein LOC114973131 n=1 Tax=Acropora millepora TaxID=45264 RepID=UPI001CF2FCCB|nr:uncharacterized protein LOC114973131 [Acropora millepora]
MFILLVAVAFCCFTKTVWPASRKMSVALYAIYLISLVNTGETAGEQCKVYQVPIHDKALRGHTYQTAKVGELFRCYVRCERDPACKSCNFKHTHEICEMNNETEETKPNDFIAEKGSYYIKRTGEDVDECTAFPNICGANAHCHNTDGSYICNCKAGYTGDGKTCSRADYKGYSASNPALSCADILANRPESKSAAYYLKTEDGGVASTYCHMENIGGCGGGGWTLVMKIDGAKTTFSYNSDLWTNKVPLNQSSGKSGFDHDETKMPSFWSTPFTKLCLGMQAAGQETNWITVSYQASSLHSLMSTNSHLATNVGRDRWKSLLADSSLQRNCNMEGFNVKPSSRQNHHAVTRIGILGNNQDECRSCNSRIGFGSEGSSHGQQDDNSCGNESAERGNDNGEKRIKANCFIFLQ